MNYQSVSPWYRLLGLVFVLFFATNIRAQKVTDGGSGGFLIGYRQMDVAGFQAFLPDIAPDLNNSFLLLGGEGYSMFNRFIVGGKGYFLGGSRVSWTGPADNFEGRLAGGAGFFNFGYAVVNQQRLLVFPLIGIGGGGMTLTSTLDEDVDFDDVVTNGTGVLPLETNVSNGSFLLDFELGADFFPFRKDYGLKLGLRAGYTLALRRDRWDYSGGEIRNGPDGNVGGFHVSLTVGGGGFE